MSTPPGATSKARARALAALLVSVLALAALPARADVWGYVDPQGTAHFASEKLDARYELFFRGGEDFDTAQGLGRGTPRPVAVPTTSVPRLIAFFEVSPSYKQVKHHLKEAARTHGVDYDLLKAVIATESGFDPRAVSPKGAVGLMQVMPTTAERWGLAGDARTPLEKKLTDPRTNVRIGARYLRHLIDLFPDRLDLAVAAYNAGEGAVQRAGNRVPEFRETRNYVKTVLQLYGMLKPPAVAASGRAPKRVRMEIPGTAVMGASPVPGGAFGRGNMPAAASVAPPAQDNYTD